MKRPDKKFIISVAKNGILRDWLDPWTKDGSSASWNRLQADTVFNLSTKNRLITVFFHI